MDTQHGLLNDNGSIWGESAGANHSIFRAAFDSARDGISIKDKHLRYLYVNPALLRIWDAEASMFLGKTNAEIFPDPDKGLEDLDRRVLRGEEIEYDVLWPDGADKYYVHTIRTPLRDDSGDIFGICVIARDITEHRRAQEALRASEERFRAVVQSTSDSVWIKDRSLKFTHVNPAFVKLWGASSADAFIGKTRQESFGEQNNHVEELERRVLNGEKVEEDVYFPTDMWDFHFYDVRSPLRNSQGEIIGICGIRRDLTDHIRAEETLRRASRFEAAMTSARGIAHDFSNLMTIILGNIGLLRMQVAELPESPTQLDSVYRTAQRAKDMAQQMLTLARGGNIVDLKPVSLQAVIDEMISIYGYSVPRELNIETNINADLWDVRADSSQMSRMLMNLGINAVEAMKMNGTIRLSTNNVSIDRIVAEKYPGLAVGSDYVHLCFEDTGCGMDKETMEKLFEPFYSTKAEGRGLGLSAVYATIKSHDGHIFCRSQIGRGTTFDIFLPACRQASGSVSNTNVDLPRGTEVILVIDQEELVVATSSKILKSLGYRVLDSSTIAGGMEVLGSTEEPIDLVIIDRALAEAEGGGVFAMVRELRPNVKVVVCSPYTTNMLSRPLPRNKLNGFIHKPFRQDILASAIRRILDGTTAQRATFCAGH